MVLLPEKTARRQQIEMRIEMHRDTASGSLLEIGRQLNAAKAEGLIPHGQWTAWVAQHAWMSERNAQKWMRAARELPPDSPLGALGIAKIQSLMLLDAGEREEFAEQIGADKLSSREVDAAVKAARAERDEALRVMGEQKRKLQEAEQAKTSAVTDAIARTRVDVTREKQEEIDRLKDTAVKAERERRRMLEELTETRQRADAARQDAAKLHQELVNAQAQPDPEQAQRIALLEAQLKSRTDAIIQMEAELDRLSEQLDEAQTAAMRGGMSGDGERRNPATAILGAIGALMAEAGRAPGELARVQGLDAETKQLLTGQAQIVGQWAMQIIAICKEGGADE